MTDPNDARSDGALAGLTPQQRSLLMLELARRRRAERTVVPRQPRSGEPARFPASAGQERLWYLHQLDPASVAYVLPVVVRLRGALDEGALERSLRWLVRRHEALRTGFEGTAEGVRQFVHGPDTVAIGLDRADATEETLPAAVRAFVARGFDPARPPLLRATLLRLGPEDVALVIAVHHLVVDGWSLAVLVDDLEAAYRAGGDPDLPAPDLQYADYAHWEHQQRRGSAWNGDLEYWREHLRGAQPLELPADTTDGDRPDPSAGDAVPLRLTAELVGRVGALAATHDATPFMVLTAALSVVLARWTGRSDLLIGTPVAGRHQVELERIVGFFVNTVALRIRTTRRDRFTDLLDRVRDECVQAFAHQQVPFDRVVAELPDRPVGGDLVRVLFAMRNVGMRPLRLPGLSTEVVEIPGGGAQLDVALELVPAPDGGLHGSLEYAAGRFTAATAGRLAAAFQHVLDAAVADPDRQVDRLPVMPGAAGWAAVAPPTGAPRPLVPEWFATVAAATPAAVAVVVDASGERLTYGELDLRVRRLTRALRGRVGPEDRVGVALEPGVDLVVTFLAVLRAGAVYLPLDPTTPPVRRAAMLADAAPVLVITNDPSSGPDENGVSLDSLLTQEVDGTDAPVPVHPASAAYVLFTSGSTGRPKGVVITHGAIANRIVEMHDRDGFDREERVLQRTSIGFDPSLTEMLAPLLAGGTLVVARPDRSTDPDHLLDAIDRHGVTSIDFVPSLLRLMLDRPDADGRLGRLRRLYSGGEELSSGLARRFTDLCPATTLINLYGPTEAAVDVSAQRVTAPVPSRVPIGTALGGVELVVLDGALRPLPPGVPGELFVGGVQVARGYLGRPGLTAERFVPHPLRPGARLYATGDRVRRDEQGTLDFLGRIDHQLKIRGTRIEPAEVEAALRAVPGVADAAVSAQDDRLVAHLVAVEGTDRPTAAQVRTEVADRLSAAMVPTAFVWLPALPLTSAGKIDRSALPPVPASEPSGVGPVAPDGALEEVLAGVWADVLDVASVGVSDDFYALGGHSLLSTQIVARLNDLLRVELSVRDLVGVTTVREFAPVVRNAGATAGVDVDRVAKIVLAVSAMSADEVDERLGAQKAGR
ncbi:non-ribosomal peptide synthetase [Micromonospora sp. DT229]|uniref:non-ribosomal peptide synthetase n=1 Tax=Micromonospora sp. DT229 TaxID=3393430 RepID=UPI003CFA32C7